MDSVRMHVLLAVARASDRRRLVEYLRESDSLHLTVETVDSLARCLDALAHAPFDAVVLDSDLPDAPEGPNALEGLLGRAFASPVVLLATDDEARELTASLEGHATVEVLATSRVSPAALSEAILRVTRRRALGALRSATSAHAESLVTRGLAHDFNNLLAVIAANVEMARESEGDWLDKALTTIGEARSLASQLLSVRERRTDEMERISAEELLRGTLRLLRATLSPAVDTTLRIEGGTPDVIGDRVQLSRVLTNLLLNARDAVLERAAAEPEEYAPGIVVDLSLRSTDRGDWIDIAIEDNGPGISREKVVRIFEPFFTTKGSHGTGLGLATCRRIVGEHGGELTVTTIEGEGCRFVLSLPAAPVPLPRIAPARLRPESPAESTVLLVDDDHRVVRVLALALEREGYRVLTATDARDALRLAVSGPIDAILLDVWMPGMNGWQMLTRLRALGVRAPVVLMSGVPLDDDPRSLEAAALLTKPFGLAEMIEAVGRAVGEVTPRLVAIAS